MNKNIKFNIFWNTFGSIYYCICQWLITIIVVRLGSYEAAGYLSLAMTTSSAFSTIALFSMRNYQVSDVSEEYSSGIYIGSRILTSIIAFIGCFISAFLTSSIYQVLCTITFMLIRLSEALTDVLHGINQKYEHYNYIGISYILRGSATVLTFAITLIISKNLPLTLFYVAILNLIIAFGFDWRKTYSIDQFRVTVWDIRVFELLKHCIPIVIFSFLLSLENLIPKSILEVEFGADQLGIYSSIASPTLVVQVFASVAFNPFLPSISTAIYNGEKKIFKRMLHKTYLAFIGLGIIVTIGAALFGRLGLQILFKADILQYYYIFMPIVWCTLLTGITWILSSIVVALRKIKGLLFGAILDFLICILLAPHLIKAMGMNGVSAVQIISLALYIIFMVIVCEASEVKN